MLQPVSRPTPRRSLDLGHWGVPVFVFDGELFWGQDRIEDLELALRDAGLAHPPTDIPATGPPATEEEPRAHQPHP